MRRVVLLGKILAGLRMLTTRPDSAAIIDVYALSTEPAGETSDMLSLLHSVDAHASGRTDTRSGGREGAAGERFRPSECPTRRHVTATQSELHDRLVRSVRDALPLVYRAERATEGAERAYRSVAVVIVRLRHEFTAGDGKTPDLRGRSRGYRSVVRHAYVEAGAASDGPVEKRLSAGVSYWVRKLLIDRYGEERLRDLGVLPHAPTDVLHKLIHDGHIDDPTECMATVAGVLNILASDTSFTPAAEQIRSAARALALMQTRVNRSVEVA